MGQASFVRTTLSGLTLGSLYFMVAAGLTLIFGLMDVLNFAHGAMFMMGAYLGWQFYTNPSFLFAIVPLISAGVCGLMTSRLLRPWVMKWPIPDSLAGTAADRVLILPGSAIAMLGCLGLRYPEAFLHRHGGAQHRRRLAGRDQAAGSRWLCSGLRVLAGGAGRADRGDWQRPPG